MAKLNIDLSGRGGLCQFQGTSVFTRYLAGDNQMVTGVFNPFTRPGYMSPVVATLTSVTVDQALAATLGSSFYDAVNDDFYFAERGRQLYKGDTVSDTTLTRSIQLAAAGAEIMDIESYMVNGERRMFVMYKDAGSTAEIAISPFPYDTASDNETFTGTCAGDNIGANSLSDDFFMIAADNGFAYLCMENQVHLFDGTVATGGANGTMDSNALLFPVDTRIVDGLDWGGNLYLAIHKYTTSTRTINPTFTIDGPVTTAIYVWDRSTTSVNSANFIPLPNVSEIKKIFISPAGRLRALVVTSEGFSELQEFTGNGMTSIHRLTYLAFPVFRDSVGTFLGMTVWHGKDGGLWGYGSVLPGEPEGLFQLGQISTHSNNGGAIMTARGTSAGAPAIYTAYMSTGASASIGRMPIFTGHNQGQTGNMNTSTIATPVKFLPCMSTVNYVDIYMYPTTGSGTTSVGTVGAYFNGQSTAFGPKTITHAHASRGYFRMDIGKSYVNSIQLEITPPSATALSANDFAPTLAVVDYTPTGTSA